MITKRKYENALKVVKEYEQQQRLAIYDSLKSQNLTPDTEFFDVDGISDKLGGLMYSYYKSTVSTADWGKPLTLSYFADLKAEEFTRYRGVGSKTLMEYVALMDAAGIQV
jgi:hypothetical protein